MKEFIKVLQGLLITCLLISLVSADYTKLNLALGVVPSYRSMELNSDGFPCLIYIDNNTDLYYTCYNGGSSFVGTTKIGENLGVIRKVALDLDVYDNPHVAYVNNSRRLCYYDGSTGVTNCTIGTAGQTQIASIELDSSNRPHIFYCETGANEYIHAYKTSGVWNKITVTAGCSGHADDIYEYPITIDSVKNHVWMTNKQKIFNSSLTGTTFTQRLVNLGPFDMDTVDTIGFMLWTGSYDGNFPVIASNHTNITNISANALDGQPSVSSYLGNIYGAYEKTGDVYYYDNTSGNFVTSFELTDAEQTTFIDFKLSPTTPTRSQAKYILYTSNYGGTETVTLAYESDVYEVSGTVYNSVTYEPIDGVNVLLDGVNSYGDNTDALGEFVVSDVQGGIYDLVVSKTGYTTFSLEMEVTQSLYNFDIYITPVGTSTDVNYTSANLEFRWESDNTPVVNMTVQFEQQTQCSGCASNYFFSTDENGQIHVTLPESGYLVTLPRDYYLSLVDGFYNSIELDFTTGDNLIYSFKVINNNNSNKNANVTILSKYDNSPVEGAEVVLTSEFTQEVYYTTTDSNGRIDVGFQTGNQIINYRIEKENYTTKIDDFYLGNNLNNEITIYLDFEGFEIKAKIIDYDTREVVENYKIRVYCSTSPDCFGSNSQIIQTTNSSGETSFYPQKYGHYYLTTVEEFIDYPFYDSNLDLFYYSLPMIDLNPFNKDYDFALYVKSITKFRDVFGVVRDSRGNVLENAIVTLEYNNVLHYSDITNASGGYYINNVSVDTRYKGEATKTGYNKDEWINMIVDSSSTSPFEADFILSFINTTERYSFIVQGSITNCDNTKNLSNVDIVIECEGADYRNRITTSDNNNSFIFNVTSHLDDEYCHLLVQPFNIDLKEYRSDFSISENKDFGAIPICRENLTKGFDVCFINEESLDPFETNDLGCYNVEGVNVTLSRFDDNDQNISVYDRAITGATGCVTFYNMIYGNYLIEYNSDYFGEGEVPVTIDEYSNILGNNFYKSINVNPDQSLYSLKARVLYIENLTYINYTTESYGLEGAKFKLHDVARDKTFVRYADEVGNLRINCIPDSYYEVTITADRYDDFSDDFQLSGLEGNRLKNYDATLIIDIKSRDERMSDEIGGFLTSENVTLGILVIFGLFGGYIIILLFGGIVEEGRKIVGL